MDKIIAELYALTTDRISVTPGYQEKIHALAIAKIAILEEMEQLAGENIAHLLDVYTSLDGERQELHEQTVFEFALRMGMGLGRIGFKA